MRINAVRPVETQWFASQQHHTFKKNAGSEHLFQQILYLLYRAKATKPKVLVAEKCQASITLLHFLRSRILQSKKEIWQVINGKSSDPCDIGVVNYGECRSFSTSRFFGNRCNRSDTREIEQDENKERECRMWREISGGEQRIGECCFVFITIQYAEGADDYFFGRRTGDQGNGCLPVQTERVYDRFAEFS